MYILLRQSRDESKNKEHPKPLYFDSYQTNRCIQVVSY